jgi:hypothetical protein
MILTVDLTFVMVRATFDRENILKQVPIVQFSPPIRRLNDSGISA